MKIKPIFLSFILLVAGYWLPVSSAYAEAPNLITYQGRLKENNQPVTGNRNIEILLCDAFPGGAGNCYSSGTQAVYVSTGLFKSTFTVPGAVDLSAGNWWLELKVEGIALSPREQLSSVPYALNSATAAYANNLAASIGAAGVISSTHVYIINGSNLTVAGSVTANAFYGNGAGLTGVTGASGTDVTKVLKAGDTMTGRLTAPDYTAEYGLTASTAVFSSGITASSITVIGDAFSVGGSTLVVVNGNVGIGTTAPAARLDIDAGTNNAINISNILSANNQKAFNANISLNTDEDNVYSIYNTMGGTAISGAAHRKAYGMYNNITVDGSNSVRPANCSLFCMQSDGVQIRRG